MIYLLEDDDSIRKLVSYALIKEGYEVADFAEPKAFWNSIQKRPPKLVLLDIMLPDEDGLHILDKLRANPSTRDLPIIMLTARSSEYDKVIGLDMGADDYITKPFGMTELVSRVRALLRRAKITEGIETDYTVGDLYVNPSKHIVTVKNEEVCLSFKEFSLLTALLEANGNVVTRNTLLCKVWGEYYDESRTLDVHIRKLRVKLGNMGGIIHTVKNIGYKIGGE